MYKKRQPADSDPEALAILREQELRKRHAQSRAVLAQLVLRGDCDLHMHSNASDGSDSPPALLQKVMQQGLKAYALTDHDGVSGLEAMDLVREKLTKLGVELPDYVPGLEVSASYALDEGSQEVHVLGYFPLGGIEGLAEFLEEQRQSRDERNRQVCARLQELGFEISFEELQGEGSEVIGRPHVAALMVRKGYAGSYREAFDDWLSAGRPAYVRRKQPPVEEVIRVIRAAGGLPVLAHPSLYAGWMTSEAELRERFQGLQAYGLDGVELYQGETTLEHARLVSRAVAGLGLLPTIGSDYHGVNKNDVEMLRAGMDWSELFEPHWALLEQEAGLNRDDR